MFSLGHFPKTTVRDHLRRMNPKIGSTIKIDSNLWAPNNVPKHD